MSRVVYGSIIGLALVVVAVAFGILFPAVFFLLAATDALQAETAFAIAKWTGLGLIGVYGYAARASRARAWPRPWCMPRLSRSSVPHLIVLKSLVH